MTDIERIVRIAHLTNSFIVHSPSAPRGEITLCNDGKVVGYATVFVALTCDIDRKVIIIGENEYDMVVLNSDDFLRMTE